MSFTMGMMPVERPRNDQPGSRSAYNSPITSPIHSPAGSRRSSVSSLASVQTDPGDDRFRQFSMTSVSSTSSTKSGFRSLFSRKEKKPKEKKDYDNLVLTSRHAAQVKTKLMMKDPRASGKAKVKTAGVVGTIKSGHLTAAAQEARHPHSGPPAMHAKDEMPALTRIISADEPDEEDEVERNERLRREWETSKQSAFTRVVEHESDESAQASAEVSADEDDSPIRSGATSPVEKALRLAELRRPAPIARSSFGGRFKKDENGNWKR